ncbi:MAG: ABC transporter substrate-binding protein [Pseudorhodoplanes sp.]
MTITRRAAMDRRTLLKSAVATGLAAFPIPALAQARPLKVGFMLPYTGTYAALGKMIDNGFRQYVAERGGALGGRPIEYVVVDDQAEPAKGPDNMTKLVEREKVDAVIGTVHSGVAMAMVKIARETGKLLIIPNAGAAAATGPLCAPNIFRTSFTNWQPCYPMGKVVAQDGHKTAVTITWKYAAGEEMAAAFKQGFAEAGGTVKAQLFVPFPEVEFQALLTQIAELKPDAVFTFFAGGGAVKFVRDYAAAGLKKSIPLYGPGFLTDGTLPAQGEAAEGMKTTLHYADDLDNAENRKFRAEHQKRYNAEPDVYAVQGYDSAALLGIGLAAVGGDIGAKEALSKAMQAAKIASPRGPISFSASRNVVQNIYLCEVRNGKNSFVRVAHEALADPGTGCRAA